MAATGVEVAATGVEVAATGVEVPATGDEVAATGDEVAATGAFVVGAAPCGDAVASRTTDIGEMVSLGISLTSIGFESSI